MTDITITTILDIATSIGVILLITWIGFMIYLKSKWLIFVENILENGCRPYSLNLFHSSIGTLHYGSVFLSKFHAKRYGLLKKIEQIPSHVQRLFITSFCFGISGSLLTFGSIYLTSLL
jgi:sulfoxide reductase heme-binding subunit YedZ